MALTERLAELVRACFTGVWLVSYEQTDAVQEIAQLCVREQWRLATWDIEQGLRLGNATTQSSDAQTVRDPVGLLRAIPSLSAEDETVLVVLEGFHRFLNSAEIIQGLAHQIHQGKQRRVFLIVLAPVVQLPPELEKLFIILQHELPDRNQLLEIARGIATQADELPAGDELARVLDAASGLTRFEAEAAFSLSVIRHGRVEPEPIWQLKAQTLLKSGLLTLHCGGEDFSQLGGLEALKAFSQRLLRRNRPTNCRPKGLLLLGVPGTGKSGFAKALGQESGRPTLILDVGSLMGSLVGQTEERTRQALAIVDAMAPCVCMIDEIEKAFGGLGAGSATDSGVSARIFGTLLSWLNDHESDAVVVCTCNDLSKLPPEFARAERFDAVFFLDLPSSQQKEVIWQQYLRHYELPAKQSRPGDQSWTGAEIRSCCRLARLLDLSLVEAAQNVVPVAVTAAESVARLQAWADGRCLNAEKTGIYRRQPAETVRRRVSRNPSDN